MKFSVVRRTVERKPERGMIRRRIRIRYRKTKDVRLISHLDLVRTMERLFRRAELRLSMSEGFHPKPRMSFPLALAVGIAGTDEVMEVELAEEPDADALLLALRTHAPDGLEIASVEVVPPGAKKPRVQSLTYEVAVPASRQAAAQAKLDELWSATTHVYDRGDGRPAVDVRRDLVELVLEADVLRFRMRYAREGSSRPRDVLAVLGLDDLEREGFFLTRTAVELEVS